MILDFHNHLSPPGSPYRMDAQMYLDTMDEAGVDRLVILGKDYGEAGDRRGDNLADEDTAGFVRAHPDRFIGFTAVHPDREASSNIARIERAVDEFGLQGMFAAYERFMAGEQPYQYRDFDTGSGDLRAWGMITDNRVLLWIDNRLHTWRRVADQQPTPPASGTLTIPDMEGLWLVQWWDTTSGLPTKQSTVYAPGALVLPVNDLAGDVAVKAVKLPANLHPEAYRPLVQRQYPR